MSTEVFVQWAGVVNHKHPGVKGWHNPAAKHGNANLHAENDAAHPTNGASVLTTKQLQSQYALALGGKSFYGAYDAAVSAKRADAGDNWPYAKRAKPEVSKAEAIAESLTAMGLDAEMYTADA